MPNSKIQHVQIGSTNYDVDLPSDATPSITSLTVSGNISTGTINSKTISDSTGANTIPTRDNNGNTALGMINTNISTDNTNISSDSNFLYVNNDGYIRKAAAASFRSAIGATDTKNTAGGDDTSDTLYLVGMKSQTSSGGYAVTYTDDNTSVTNGALQINSVSLKGNITYRGTKTTKSMITFKDNTTVNTGDNGLIIGGGGLVIVAGGDSGENIYNGESLTPATEKLYLGSEGEINFVTNIAANNYSTGSKKMIFDTSGNLSVPGTISEGGLTLSSKYSNQNAYGKITVGSTTTTADSTTDTITFAAGGDLNVAVSGKTITYSATLPTSFSLTDNILDGSANKYEPYSSTTANSTWVGTAGNAGKLYLGDQNPSKTTRLNYNGYLYATKLYSGAAEVAKQSDLALITTAPTANNTSGMVKFVYLESEPANKYEGYIYLIKN